MLYIFFFYPKRLSVHSGYTYVACIMCMCLVCFSETQYNHQMISSPEHPSTLQIGLIQCFCLFCQVKVSWHVLARRYCSLGIKRRWKLGCFDIKGMLKIITVWCLIQTHERCATAEPSEDAQLKSHLKWYYKYSKTMWIYRVISNRLYHNSQPT